MRVQAVLFDGFDPLDVLGPLEVLYAGGHATDGALTVELVSAEGPRDVPSGLEPISLKATARLDPARADLVLLPGAAGATEQRDPDDDSIPARLGRTLRTELPGLLGEALARPGVTVASVCGGSLLLALAGLIEGRPATGHHAALDGMAGLGVRTVRARVVDDGDLVTGGGVTSGLDLGLYLLERGFGPRVAHAVEELFAYERRGVVWSESGTEPVAI
ncbi:DJ-1/PfpI family protein [Streptomyces sp. NRRL B-1347]|uniref:DJ-1/PfpI family protein n=1 Tax=Streptomyces sp. NRRL B-1347 TaxID=1476877 RepID=UPI0004C4C5FE|nr:DJ-1/PfpI family protein [Streptomyces sp. NRRL B-1347]